MLQTIKFAFGTQDEVMDRHHIQFLEKPVAVYPSSIHSRIKDQHGCFTLHGDDNRDFESIIGIQLVVERRLLKYAEPKEPAPAPLRELYDIGIIYSTLFQNLDGLANDPRYQLQIR